MSVPQERINDFTKLILKMGADVDFWTRGTPYNDLALRRANAIVVILEGNRFNQPRSSIPHGTKSEINLATELGIPVYLGYINAASRGTIYETNANKDASKFEGLPGTSGRFQRKIDAWEIDENAKKVVAKHEEDALKKAALAPQYAEDYTERNNALMKQLKSPKFHNPPLIVGSSGNLVEHLKGYKDKYGVPAPANAEFVRHTQGVIDLRKTSITYDKRLLILLL